MQPTLVFVALILPKVVMAESYRCEEISWREEAQLQEILDEQQAAGWSLVSFPKPGTACFAQNPGAWTYECRRLKWRKAADLTAGIAALATHGWALVAFAKPGTLCVRRAGAPSAAAPAPVTSGPAVAAPPPSSKQPAAPPQTAFEAKPQGDVRARAEKLQEELKALEVRYKAGEITAEEYERRKRELQGS